MQAIILAAGLGNRIQSVANSIPKCMLEVNGKRIIQYQLDVLHSNGINAVQNEGYKEKRAC